MRSRHSASANAEQRENGSTLMLGRSWERKYHGAIRKLFDAEGYGSRMATERLIRFCQENRIDVIHMHNLHGCYLNLKRWFAYLREADLPVIWTLHDCWAVTGHCAHFTYVGCEKWKTECTACPQLRSYPECIGLDGSRRNFRLKRRLFTAVPKLTLVTPCRWLEGIVQESFLAKIPTRVIYNGVDTKRFRPTVSGIRQEYGLQNQKLLLAVASVWTDRKGLNVLTELSQMAGRRLPDCRARVIRPANPSFAGGYFGRGTHFFHGTAVRLVQRGGLLYQPHARGHDAAGQSGSAGMRNACGCIPYGRMPRSDHG